ncbi:HD domain-containing protein [Nocardia sp. NPDC057272]|uniref:HD domain-containing protein n=1 Tax=Nocardia sp. NPDC057272 TaxID=3346079 RepID=UPI003631CF74
MGELTEAAVTEIPGTEIAQAAVGLVATVTEPAIANHSIRSYLFGRLAAQRLGADPGRDFDPDLLFLATVLHDVGLSDYADRRYRFEVDGADAAAEFMSARGYAAPDVDAVWEAIALHTSPQIATRKSTLCQLTSTGVGCDFDWAPELITDEEGAAINAAFPRHNMVTSLVDIIVEQARDRPEKQPPFSPALIFTAERQAGATKVAMEIAGEAGRWGN